ncbi:MAG: MgtC/SapB family protein [Acidimicrobiales bacterium]
MNGLFASMSAHQVLDFFVRAAVALALGAVIGLERQWRQRMAGLRTNALVSLGAALFVLFGLLISRSPGIDPTRIAAYVVSGVGFLGAGVILRDGVNVRGINTAATIWCSSAVGVLAGGGYVIEATLGAILVAVAHVALRPMGRQFDRLPASEESEVQTVYRFRAVCHAAEEAYIRALVVQASPETSSSSGRFAARTSMGARTSLRWRPNCNASDATTSDWKPP